MPVTSPEWRFVLCDIDGNYLSDVSGCALGKHFEFELNRPSQCTFRVPADDPRANIKHTDGEPFLSCGNRTLKCYRLNPVTGVWTIRFNGYIEKLTDISENTELVYSSVVAYDPQQLLNQRLVCSVDGNYTRVVKITSTQLSLLAQALVERTNTNYGETGIDTISGTFGTTTALPFVSQKEYIGPKLVSITNTNLCDVWFDPVDLFTGKMVVMNAAAMRGSDKNAAVFALGRDPGNITNYTRDQDMSTFANDVILFSSPAGALTENTITSRRQDAASITKYRRRQALDVDWDIDQSTLDDVADAELLIRKVPRQTVSIVPAPQFSATPWDDYFLGDNVFVYTTDTATREGIAGTQRVYKISLDVDDDGFEKVTELQCSINAG